MPQGAANQRGEREGNRADGERHLDSLVGEDRLHAGEAQKQRRGETVHGAERGRDDADAVGIRAPREPSRRREGERNHDREASGRGPHMQCDCISDPVSTQDAAVVRLASRSPTTWAFGPGRVSIVEMTWARIAWVLTAMGVSLPGVARAEAVATPEHTLVVGVGGASELDLGDGSAHGGANVMVEWDAIAEWLELEVGASVLAIPGGVEVPVDLLVKKPFTLAPWAEVMIGVGPEVVRVTSPGSLGGGTYFGGEAALDFMFWPWGPRVGLWVEPEYDLVAHDGAMSGIGSTGGVLFGW